MNLVFNDYEGLYDNNAGNNYRVEIVGGKTLEEWNAEAPLRLAAEVAKKEREERERLENAQKLKDVEVMEVGTPKPLLKCTACGGLQPLAYLRYKASRSRHQGMRFDRGIMEHKRCVSLFPAVACSLRLLEAQSDRM